MCMWKNFLLKVSHPEGGEALEQVAQRGRGCPIPEGMQGQAGCGSGQPGVVVGDPAHSRGLELTSTVVLFNPGHSVILQFLPPSPTSPGHHSSIPSQEHWPVGTSSALGTTCAAMVLPVQKAALVTVVLVGFGNRDRCSITASFTRYCPWPRLKLLSWLTTQAGWWLNVYTVLWKWTEFQMLNHHRKISVRLYPHWLAEGMPLLWASLWLLPPQEHISVLAKMRNN